MTIRQPNRRGSQIRSDEIVSYAVAAEYLNGHINLERVQGLRRNGNPFKLARTVRILELLGNPQHHLHCVHVGGTKGKGSTVAMLGAGLEASGFTVGAYTSPHLTDVCERIQINGVNIPKQDFARRMQRVALAVENDGFEDPPHFFEILTALAFDHFAEEAVDLVLVEVGLGGRFDCTNVITPDVAVITQISLDHMNVLGNTLTEIATEKAGIFKRGVPAISAPQVPEVEEVLRTEADRVGTQVRFLGQEIEFSLRFQSVEEIGPHTRMNIEFGNITYDHIVVPLPGEHQGYNCGLALASVDALRHRGGQIDSGKVITGLAGTRLRGRMEMLLGEPRLLIDVAHNAVSIAALIKTIGAHVQPDSLVVIFGCSSDKDIDGMLRALALGADKVIFSRTKSNPRACDPFELVERFEAVGGHMAQAVPDPADAVKIAGGALNPNDLIAVTGSVYLAGDVRRILSKRFDQADKAEAELGVRRSIVERLAQLRRR